jgi:perosamine synthetase
MERISHLERAYVSQALDNAFATSLNSVFNNRLEQAFAKMFHTPYAIGHCNGTATMHTALAALGVRPGDEVIVPPLTMSSTSLAVLHNGSIPVFADVDKETFNISPEAIELVITPKTKAIITVALYGLPPNYDAIRAICKKHRLALIEDNAECFLGLYKGKPAGEFGDFASFSFQASKHLATGEGGMLICRDEALADNARRFNCLGYAGVSAKQGKITRQDIQDPRYARHISLGFNYRMSELQAAVACAQLERAEELVQQRIKVAALFDHALGATGLLRRQAEPEGYRNSYWSYSAILHTDCPETEWYRFRDLFQQNGGDGFYAAWLLSYDEPLFRNAIQQWSGVWQRYEAGLCPTAERLQKRMVQLKTNYWDIAEAEQQAEMLAKTVKQF